MPIILLIAVPVVAIACVLIRGDRLLKERDALIRDIEKIYSPFEEVADNVAYQGGYPPMPKPARMFIGIGDEGLVLFDKAGRHGIIGYGSVKKIEKFTTVKEKSRKFGLMAYGPLALVLNRPTVQHFLVVKYVDEDNDRNNVLAMLRDNASLEKIYRVSKQFLRAWRERGR